MVTLDLEYFKEQLDAKEDMLAMTTNFLVGTQKNLELKNIELTEAQRDIFDSVSFAKIIQTSLQPDVNVLKVFFKDACYSILQQIGIGGDTIFIKSTNTGVFFGLLDATGHGIPGAMLSISGSLILNELSLSFALDKPKALLELLNYRLYNTFNRDRHSVAHFEGTMFHYSYQSNKIDYCSANGKALLISNDGKISSLPNSKSSIGSEHQIELNNFELHFEKGCKLILFSDGLVDQFGGKNNRKYMSSQLKKLLELNNNKSASELSEIILHNFHDWKGATKQTDDVSFKIIEF
jgi:phosphoserine phosphatase RsbU/P